MAEKEIAEKFKAAPEKKAGRKQKLKGSTVLIRAVEYLEKKYDIRLNTDTNQVEIKNKKDKIYKIIDDTFYRFLRVELDMNGIGLSDDKFRNLLFSGYFFDKYAPFKDYIFNLPKWNGKDYMAEYASQIKLVDEAKHRDYFINGFKKWFTALVVSLIEDAPHRFYINQTCLIFTGKQGRFKSTFMDSLLPEAWRLQYYMEGIYNFHKEEHQKYLGQKVIINLEELAGFNRGDVEGIKARITQVVASLRLAWGKADSYYKRRASFCASTNDFEFLMDITGSRRFFVIPIERIKLAKYEISNLYAQALALYKQGFHYWFDENDIDQIEIMNDEFKIASMEEELVLNYYRKPDEEDYTFNRVMYVNATQIASRLCVKFPKLNVNNSVKRNIGKALKANEFIQTAIRINGKPRKTWHVVEVDEPVINKKYEETFEL